MLIQSGGIVINVTKKKKLFHPAYVTIIPERLGNIALDMPIIELKNAYCVALYLPVQRLVIKAI